MDDLEYHYYRYIHNNDLIIHAFNINFYLVVQNCSMKSHGLVDVGGYCVTKEKLFPTNYRTLSLETVKYIQMGPRGHAPSIPFQASNKSFDFYHK